ncbi:MAG: SigE family RNA polymerase sigma factor [Actinomycetota bacterium]
MHATRRELEFKDFFQAEAERLRRFALYLTGDREQAADLAQEALVRTYRHWGRIKNNDPGPYARRIVVNLVRSAHRRRILERKHEQDQRHRAPVTPGAVEEWMRVMQALKTLSPIRRAVVVLRFYEDLTEPQIASALDRPLGTVKSDLHRALAKLRPLLDTETTFARAGEMS